MGCLIVIGLIWLTGWLLSNGHGMWAAGIFFSFLCLYVFDIVSDVKKCQTCGYNFSEKSSKHTIKTEPKSMVVCSKCKNNFHQALSKQKIVDMFELKSNPDSQLSRTISTAVKREVWQRDNGKCVLCGTNLKLEYDHIIPFSKGGSNTARNIQLLCEVCNRKKSAKIV